MLAYEWLSRLWISLSILNDSVNSLMQRHEPIGYGLQLFPLRLGIPHRYFQPRLGTYEVSQKGLIAAAARRIRKRHFVAEKPGADAMNICTGDEAADSPNQIPIQLHNALLSR